MKDLVFPEIYDEPAFEYKDKPLFYDEGLKCCGQFEDELKKENHRQGIFAGKKEYMTWGDKPSDYKVLCKGVRTNSFLLLDS